jgi:hypothetical protein
VVHGGLSVSTLTIASASSLVAAVVVSKVWGGGTLFGAALTPVIVAVVSEGLRKPATVVATVRQTRTTRAYDPVAEGRRGLAEGDLSQARPVALGEAPPRRVHRVGPTVPAAAAAAGRTSGRSRRRLMLAVATGLVAFVVAGIVLTGSELVLGNSVVSSSKRTTYIPVKTNKKSDAEKKSETDAKTTTDTTTETTPQPQETAPATTPPDAQTPQPNTVPAAPPPEQTAPAPSPAPTPAVPAPTTSPP